MIIQQVGYTGTAMGKLSRADDVARTVTRDDGRIIELWSVRTGELLAELDTWYSRVWDGYDGTSIGRYTDGFMSGVRLALGKPGYGFTHYAVKR